MLNSLCIQQNESLSQLAVGGFFPTSVTYNSTKYQQGGIYPSLDHLRRQIHRSQMSPMTCKTYMDVLRGAEGNLSCAGLPPNPQLFPEVAPGTFGGRCCPERVPDARPTRDQGCTQTGMLTSYLRNISLEVKLCISTEFSSAKPAATESETYIPVL